MNLRFYYKKELIIYANFSYFGGKIDLTNHLTTRKITKKPKIKCIGNYELISMDLSTIMLLEPLEPLSW